MPRFVVLVLLLLTLLAPIAVRAQDRTLTESDGSRTLIVESWVPAAPDQVWAAVSTAPGWESWAVPHAWLSGDLLETSYSPTGKQGDPGNIQQRILAALPGRLLVFRNIKAPPGFPHAEVFGRVTQFLELTPEGSGTRVRLTGVNYAAGAEGDALLGFFGPGNRLTLDRLAARFGLTPLDFLAGHCWRGTLPTGEINNHCFDRIDGEIRDRHEVLNNSKKVYGGETRYVWDGTANTIRFTYTGMDGGVMKGMVRPDNQDLDFGTSDYTGEGGRVTMTTRWIRVAPNAYEARTTAASDARFNRSTRYTRVD